MIVEKYKPRDNAPKIKNVWTPNTLAHSLLLGLILAFALLFHNQYSDWSVWIVI